jgi:hydroxyacylglutathione hydrolase
MRTGPSLARAAARSCWDLTSVNCNWPICNAAARAASSRSAVAVFMESYLRKSLYMFVHVEKVVTGPLATNTYIICSAEECVVVDPGGVDRILARLGGRSVAAVVATHLHFDHVAAVAALTEAAGAPFYAHPADWAVYRELNAVAEEWGFETPDLPTPKPLGERLWIFDVWHTPGHTPGSVSLVADGAVFTGDTLFYQSVGRTDLPLGDWDLLVQSVCRLYSLPRNYVVYPGHGPETYIGLEAADNPFINADVCKTGGHRNPY